MRKDKLETFFIEYHKILLALPLIFLAICLVSIGIKYNQTGDFLNKDVSLRGGLSATVYTEQEVNIEELENNLPGEGRVRTLTDPASGRQVGIILDVTQTNEEELTRFLETTVAIKLDAQNFSLEETQAALGESFFRQLFMALLFAFILMGIVVFITFKAFIPSVAVIQAAVTDVVGALAIMNWLGVEISTAGIVAFLLVIGYSIDSDILLTTRVLRAKKGSIFDRMYGAAKTGLTMTFATIAALSVGLIFATSPVIKQMFFIIVVALLIDIASTYLTNAGLLYRYAVKKHL